MENKDVNNHFKSKIKKLLAEIEYIKKRYKDLEQKNIELLERFNNAMSRNADLRKKLFNLKKAFSKKEKKSNVIIEQNDNFELPKNLNQKIPQPPKKPKL